MPNHPKTNKISRLNTPKKPENRPNASERGYDNSWRKVRKYHLLHNPLCEDCVKQGLYIPGQDVHHIKKVSEHPHLRDDPDNLMTLCHSCHSIRTAKGE
jgi:5-methylcytosine-specific restriction protein A